MLSKNFKKAYSLIELSIVILIISVLITGALSVSVNSINNAKIKVTNDRIAEIYKALGNYMLINKKLPCPASLILAKGTTGGGTTYGSAFGADGTCWDNVNTFRVTDANLDLIGGMAPVTALGLSIEMAEDGFGNKIDYIVDKRITAVCSATQTGFCLGFTGGATNPTVPNGGGMNVRSKSSSGEISSYADVAIISHGANKLGAWPASSTTFNTAPTDAAEVYNKIINTGGYLSYIVYTSSMDSDVFDDIVLTKRRVDMLMDFNALSLIPCEARTNYSYMGNATHNLAQSNYGQVTSATTPLCTTINASYTHGPAYVQIRCGALGVWESSAAVPCS